MDWPGFFTFTGFITSLLLSLTTAAYGIGESDFTALLGFISAASLVVFVWIERRRAAPLLDLSLLRIREFTGAVTAQMINSMSWGAFLLLISLYLQLVKGFSPLQAGISIVPFDLAMLFLAPLSGRLSDRRGTRPFATAGLAVFSASLLAMSTLSPSTPYPTLLAFLLLGGAGMGLFNSPNMSSAMGSVPAHRRGVASAFRATFFNIGFVLSFNIVILVLTFYLPYGLITQIITSEGALNTIAANALRFSGALDSLFLVLTVINTTAIIPSLLRGRRVEVAPEEAEGIGLEPD